ncbi:MAG: glycoside hydrolase family 3 protein [Cellulomonadaceae bacterium]|nr:glycoside hydrolase family 3 protein [Cellulomonadaceae bacterium]
MSGVSIAVGAPQQDQELALIMCHCGSESLPNPVADWTLEQQVGALFMVGTPAGSSASASTVKLLKDRHVGGVFLHGRSNAGVTAIAKQTAAYQKAASTPGNLLIATDQEGGSVRVLQGAGFSTIPSAVKQTSDKSLATDAKAWGTQLVKAGVNVNLAPVADLVDKVAPAQNKPIGYYARNYGKTVSSVEAGAGAFAQGMQAAGVIPTLKHFPGLGRVTSNTDTTANVTDKYTKAGDDSIKIFTDLAQQLSENRFKPWVMMSLASYPAIDSENPAVFSSKTVGLLRKAGYEGVIITDDLSAATQVQKYTPAERAIKAISAGVDIVLYSATAKDVPVAMDAVIAKAKTDKAFAKCVLEAAGRVAKAQQSLVTKDNPAYSPEKYSPWDTKAWSKTTRKVTADVSLRATPEDGGVKITAIPKGTALRLGELNSTGKWYQTTFDGHQGWVPLAKLAAK